MPLYATKYVFVFKYARKIKSKTFYFNYVKNEPRLNKVLKRYKKVLKV